MIQEKHKGDNRFTREKKEKAETHRVVFLELFDAISRIFFFARKDFSRKLESENDSKTKARLTHKRKTMIC